MNFKLGQCLVAVGDDRKVWQLPGATFHWIFPKFDGHTSTCYWDIASLPDFSDHLSLFSLCAKHMLGGNRLKCCWEMMWLPVWWIEVGFTMLWSKFHDDLTKCYSRKKWKEKNKTLENPVWWKLTSWSTLKLALLLQTYVQLCPVGGARAVRSYCVGSRVCPPSLP